jgi:hypothetical protein
MSSSHGLLAAALLLAVASPGRAVTGVIDAPGRADFEACYLTTPDPLEANLATLVRGLEVEVLGRAPHGRWWVRLPQVHHPRVILHEDWPGAGPPIGSVSASFLVLPQGAPSPAPLTSPRPVPRPGGALSGIFGIPAPRTPAPRSLPGSIGALGLSPSPLATSGVATGLPTEGGLTGSAFLVRLGDTTGAAREQAILAAVQGGHLPGFLGSFVEVSLQAGGHTARVRVAPDYLAIGTDADFVRMPMLPATAQQIADHLGCALPRPRLVDAIWQAARYKLRPRPLPPGPGMGSNEYYRRANELIEQELAGRPLGGLTAGDKKDIVLTNRLASRPGQVAIYGWHRTSGSPIQPLSLVHGRNYVDYSHGVRLISRQVRVDGQETTIDAVLADPELAPLLSAEVPVTITRYP